MSTQPVALTPALVARLARLALDGVTREYPNSPAHVLRGQRTPRELHPAFYGCFDWHSAVHSHWLLVRLLRVLPQLPEAAAIHATLDAHLTLGHLEVEVAYFAERSRHGFERPYGWAWLLNWSCAIVDRKGAACCAPGPPASTACFTTRMVSL